MCLTLTLPTCASTLGARRKRKRITAMATLFRSRGKPLWLQFRIDTTCERLWLSALGQAKLILTRRAAGKKNKHTTRPGLQDLLPQRDGGRRSTNTRKKAVKDGPSTTSQNAKSPRPVGSPQCTRYATQVLPASKPQRSHSATAMQCNLRQPQGSRLAIPMQPVPALRKLTQTTGWSANSSK